MEVLTGWWVGYGIAAVVIVVVVALVGWVLSLARRISVQANDIAMTVNEIRGTTAGVPLIGKLNEKLARVVEQAATGRAALMSND